MKCRQIILGLETSTHACSIVLLCHGQYYHRLNIEAKKHSDLILPMIQSLLAEAKRELGDITDIAVGVGPGSFTGVRVAVGLAKTFGYALGKAVWPISSLRALAHQVYRVGLCDPQDFILSTWDARMKALYWGLYQIKDHTVLSVDGQSDQLCSAHALALPSPLLLSSKNKLVTVGCGVSHYYDAVIEKISKYNPKIIEDYYPNAQDIIELAIHDQKNGLSAANVLELAPEYVRNDVAKIPKNMPILG